MRNPRPPEFQDGGFEAIPTRKKRRMAAREEIRRPGKPKRWPSRKDARPGSQKSRHPRKMATREAKNAAIQEKKPPGS
ncbi:MAG: hypothetical protein ACJ76Y_12325 [Thermoanaerobaculia bacterium]